MKTVRVGGVTEKIIERKDMPAAKLKKNLGRETVAVIGYGVQGRGQSLNMTDNKVKVIIGVRKGGASWKLAQTRTRRHGFSQARQARAGR